MSVQEQDRVVMYHPEMGVYLGSCMGLGFWSKLDPAGQDSAVTFQSISEAQDVARQWDASMDGLLFTHVKTSNQYATIDECEAVGLERWLP